MNHPHPIHPIRIPYSSHSSLHSAFYLGFLGPEPYLLYFGARAVLCFRSFLMCWPFVLSPVFHTPFPRSDASVSSTSTSPVDAVDGYGIYTYLECIG